jgi:signal transduction histidine kinase
VSLLVDVASMEAGRFHVTIEDIPAKELVDEAAARWHDGSPDHPVHARTASELPEVKADGIAIGRVLDELIDNAVKFSPDGSPITVSAETHNGGVTFSVRDEGQGIEPERLAELGGAFEQIDSGDTRRFGGLGLGLNYVRGVLRIHKSRLDLTSAPNAGTTSSFTLPATGTVTRMSAKAKASRKASKTKAR